MIRARPWIQRSSENGGRSAAGIVGCAQHRNARLHLLAGVYSCPIRRHGRREQRDYALSSVQHVRTTDESLTVPQLSLFSVPIRPLNRAERAAAK